MGQGPVVGRITQLTDGDTIRSRRLEGGSRPLLKFPRPELNGTYPVVLYFGTEEDRDEFIALVKEAKPGLVARKL